MPLSEASEKMELGAEVDAGRAAGGRTASAGSVRGNIGSFEVLVLICTGRGSPAKNSSMVYVRPIASSVELELTDAEGAKISSVDGRVKGAVECGEEMAASDRLTTGATRSVSAEVSSSGISISSGA